MLLGAKCHLSAAALTLPPGLVEILPVSKAGSYYGDAVRIVDCPQDKDNPFGSCGNVLFGGLAMYDSHLGGSIQIRFFPPLANVSHFEIIHPDNLRGDDSLMKAPQVYQFPIRQGFILDQLDGVSSGDLDLITGTVTNLVFRLNFSNTFYLGLANVNPALKASAFAFPGAAGSARAEFTQRPDGLLDFTFYGSTFLPLGSNISGDPVRIPMPFTGPAFEIGSIQAPGTSLHPHIRISTKDPDGTECGVNCPKIPFNTIQQFTINSQSSTVADRFNLNVPQLGYPGNATAQSHLQGRVQIQFGDRSGDTVPFGVSLLVPEALLANPPASPLPLPPGFSLGALGHDEDLKFPALTYRFQSVVMSDDNFDISVAALNLKTGEVLGGLLYKGVFVQTLLLQVLFQNNGRIAPGSFPYRGPASFENGPNGEMVFRYQGDSFLPFEGFIWPSPDFTTAAHSFLAGPGSLLNPRLGLQAMLIGDTPQALKSGSAESIHSSIGDTFSYSYSIPCDGAGKPGSFEYTNGNSSTGGTFKMEGFASVNCLNSRTSTLSRGDYDTITFSGFGTWSKDSNPHLANVQVSTAPASSYVTIMIDGGLTSQANTRSAQEPIP
ncbi:MAG: hypothetical protein DMG57_32910 [Acidobacteria bacterium]|nr:MAG: hypothetical protein DMG57_32910 [Acidobacteriota bacterium]